MLGPDEPTLLWDCPWDLRGTLTVGHGENTVEGREKARIEHGFDQGKRTDSGRGNAGKKHGFGRDKTRIRQGKSADSAWKNHGLSTDRVRIGHGSSTD